ncbi:MAG: helix-turn-helix domain-containing protein [Acidobacteriota bacterium]
MATSENHTIPLGKGGTKMETNRMIEKILLRPGEVAELLGIGRTKAYELIGSGVLPSLRIGASVRVPMDSLRAWVAAQSDEVARTALDQRLDTAGRG